MGFDTTNLILVCIVPLISIILYLSKFKILVSPKDLLTKIINENTDLVIGKDIIVNNDSVYEKIINRGELGLAESYMDGDWDSSELGFVLNNILKHQDILELKVKYQSVNFIYLKMMSQFKKLKNTNTINKSPENIREHYDVGNQLYRAMLGENMQYTCAYFNREGMTLNEAQISKMQLIAKKLDLKPGMNVLDMGCGYGSMAHHLATNYGVIVTGVTLSPEQKQFADDSFPHKNITIEVMDYRHVKGKYDRVYSVGLFEHIGSNNYTEFFDKCEELLEDDGIMFVHTMGISRPNHNQGDYFASTYIFPEGELPDILNFTEAYSHKWRMEDFQNIGISYSKTFDQWLENIDEGSSGSKELEEYDIRFRRMWIYYLRIFAENFRCQNFLLFQSVFTKKKHIREDDCGLFIRD